MQMADRKVWSHRSWRGCMGRQSLMRAKRFFDFVGLTVKAFVGRPAGPCDGARAGCRLGCPFGKSGAEVVAVLAFIAEQPFAPGQGFKQQGCTFVVAHLQQDDRPPLAITHSMELGVQRAFGATDMSGKSPF